MTVVSNAVMASWRQEARVVNVKMRGQSLVNNSVLDWTTNLMVVRRPTGSTELFSNTKVRWGQQEEQASEAMLRTADYNCRINCI